MISCFCISVDSDSVNITTESLSVKYHIESAVIQYEVCGLALSQVHAHAEFKFYNESCIAGRAPTNVILHEQAGNLNTFVTQRILTYMSCAPGYEYLHQNSYYLLSLLDFILIPGHTNTLDLTKYNSFRLVQGVLYSTHACYSAKPNILADMLHPVMQDQLQD